MHAISYQLKRAHLCAVALGRRVLRGTKKPDDPDYDGVPDMTPARFDILYLVLGRPARVVGMQRGSMAMADIVRHLGLARATISKAVKRLVQLGLVTTEPIHGRGNEKLVRLTKEGDARIKRALHLVFTGRFIARHYRRFVAKNILSKPPNLPWVIGLELDRIWFELQDVARHLFDRSTVLYNIRAEPEL